MTLSSLVPAPMLRRILALYDDLPYHGPGHAVAVRDQALGLAHRATGAGVVVDLEVVELAALLHDAGYRTAPADRSREQHAADLAGTLLASRGYRPALVGAVAGCILATELEATPSTVEGRLVRAADLAAMAAPYPVFAANNAALRVECELLSGTRVSTESWRTSVAAVIGGYLDRGLVIPGPDPVGDEARWRCGTRANLDRYLRVGR